MCGITREMSEMIPQMCGITREMSDIITQMLLICVIICQIITQMCGITREMSDIITQMLLICVIICKITLDRWRICFIISDISCFRRGICFKKWCLRLKMLHGRGHISHLLRVRSRCTTGLRPVGAFVGQQALQKPCITVVTSHKSSLRLDVGRQTCG